MDRVMTLQQHFGDAAGRSKVAVDLERRVRVEQVGVDATAARVLRTGLVHQRQ